jgi:hypothetical protein
LEQIGKLVEGGCRVFLIYCKGAANMLPRTRNLIKYLQCERNPGLDILKAKEQGSVSKEKKQYPNP